MAVTVSPLFRSVIWLKVKVLKVKMESTVHLDLRTAWGCGCSSEAKGLHKELNTDGSK